MTENSGLSSKPRVSLRLINLLKATNGSTSNWQMPPFPTEKEDKENCQTSNDEVKIFASRGSQIEDEDWALLEMRQTDDEIFDSKSLNQNGPSDGQIEDNETPVLIELPFKQRSIYDQRIDKGTSTDDLPGDMIKHEKIIKLQIRFPRADLAHIEEVLNACHGDLQWATNLLDQFNDEHFDSDIFLLDHHNKNIASNNNQQGGEYNCVKENPGPTNQQYLSIYLNPETAEALQQLFGQVLKDDEMAEDSLRVEIPPSVAKLMHNWWKKTYNDTSKRTTNHFRPRSGSSPAKSQRMKTQNRVNAPQVLYQPKSELEEIMDLEKALTLSEKEYNRESRGYFRDPNDKKNMATKMKRQELKETFPGLDERVLEDIFEAHDFNIKETIETINNSYGITQTLPKLPDDGTFDEDDYEDIQKPSVRKTASSSETYELESLRWEMFNCKEKRKDLLTQAKICYQGKKYAVASYYTKQAQDCMKELKTLKEKVIKCVIQANPSNTLDLHGIHGDEVLTMLSTYIMYKEKEIRHGKMDKIHLNIITGRGAHSLTGPKLKPMVIQYLTQKKYKFTIPNPGMIKVTIS